jgi:hypothetical protein
MFAASGRVVEVRLVSRRLATEPVGDPGLRRSLGVAELARQGNRTPARRCSSRWTAGEGVHSNRVTRAVGFDRLSGIGRALSVFGSARTPREHPHYRLMRAVGSALGDAGYAVITGGGGGLMEPANRGTRDVGARDSDGREPGGVRL